MSKILIVLIRVYQTVARPFLGDTCRFSPTCSDYACQALHEHGPVRGLWFATRRILRCNPWSAGGHDPVPASHRQRN